MEELVDDFEEWVRYVDSFKNADGAIDLAAHPDFFEKVIPDIIGLPRRGLKDLPDNLGLTVNYELKEHYVPGRARFSQILIVKPFA